MLLVVMLGPCTVCVVCGLFDLLGLLFIANSTCIGLFTLCQVCRGCSNDTVIPLVSFVRSLAASGAGVLMLFCIVLFPCTKGMFTNDGHRRTAGRVRDRVIHQIFQNDFCGNRAVCGRLLDLQRKGKCVFVDRFCGVKCDNTVTLRNAEVSQHTAKEPCTGHQFINILIIARNNCNTEYVFSIGNSDSKGYFIANLYGICRCNDRNGCLICRANVNGNDHHHDHQRRKKS